MHPSLTGMKLKKFHSDLLEALLSHAFYDRLHLEWLCFDQRILDVNTASILLCDLIRMFNSKLRMLKHWLTLHFVAMLLLFARLTLKCQTV